MNAEMHQPAGREHDAPSSSMRSANSEARRASPRSTGCSRRAACKSRERANMERGCGREPTAIGWSGAPSTLKPAAVSAWRKWPTWLARAHARMPVSGNAARAMQHAGAHERSLLMRSVLCISICARA